MDEVIDEGVILEIDPKVRLACVVLCLCCVCVVPCLLFLLADLLPSRPAAAHRPSATAC